MAVGTTAAILISAGIAAGSSAYQANQQKQDAKGEQGRREREAAAAKTEADRIANETKPEEEALTEIEFGVNKGTEDVGSTGDFLVPRTSALGSSGGRSGLGFKV